MCSSLCSLLIVRGHRGQISHGAVRAHAERRACLAIPSRPTPHLCRPSLSPAEPYLGRKSAPVPPASIKPQRNSGCTSIRPSGPSPSNLGIRIDSPRLTDARACLVPSCSRRFRAHSRAMPAVGPCSTPASRLRPSQPAPSTPRDSLRPPLSPPPLPPSRWRAPSPESSRQAPPSPVFATKDPRQQ